LDIHWFQRQFVPDVGFARTLLMLHGTGGTEDEFIPIAKYLDPLAAIIRPRGRTSENGMLRFFRRLVEGVFDIPPPCTLVDTGTLTNTFIGTLTNTLTGPV